MALRPRCHICRDAGNSSNVAWEAQEYCCQASNEHGHGSGAYAFFIMDEFRMLLMAVYTSSVCRMPFSSSKGSINHTDLHEDTQERKGCDKDILSQWPAAMNLKWNIKQQNKVEVLKSTALQCAIIRRTYTTFMLSCQMLLLSHARFENKV